MVAEGQSDVCSDTNQHFIALVRHQGLLWEIDGRKKFPVAHGPTTADSLLEDATEVVKQYMARDPNELRFTMVALSKGEPFPAEIDEGHSLEVAAVEAAAGGAASASSDERGDALSSALSEEGTAAAVAAAAGERGANIDGYANSEPTSAVDSEK